LQHQRRQLETDGIEIDRRHEARLAAIDLVGSARIGIVKILRLPIFDRIDRIDVADRVVTVHDIGPEIIQIGRIGKMAGHADDSDIQRRRCGSVVLRHHNNSPSLGTESNAPVRDKKNQDVIRNLRAIART
jgi:hypothetical protein